MQIIDNLIILLLIAVSFAVGKHISDSYNKSKIEELEFQLRLYAAERGVGYVAPPVKKRVPIGQPFMDKLKTNGHATQALRSSPN
jgi:hypothetical protein